MGILATGGPENLAPCLALPVRLPENSYHARDGALLALLGAKGEQPLPWIANNFLNLEIRKDYTQGSVADFVMLDLWGNCPWIIRHNLPHAVLAATGLDCIAFIKRVIQSGYYVFLHIDRYYLPVYPLSYHKTHFYHEVLVYGYTENEILFCDYIEGRRYRTFTGSCEDFRAAFQSNAEGNAWDYLSGLDILELRDCDWYAYDPDKTVRELTEYVQSRCETTLYDLYPGGRETKDATFFGLDVYLSLFDFLELVQENPKVRLITQPIQLEHCHKMLALRRIAYLVGQKRLDPSDRCCGLLERAGRECLLARNYALKSQAAQDRSALSDAVEHLRRAQAADWEGSVRLLEALKNG